MDAARYVCPGYSLVTSCKNVATYYKSRESAFYSSL